jgi:hypothetical protein
MLSSDCSQIGTGSSNSPRSANESAFFAYNLEMAENLRVTRRRAVDGEPESASLRAIRQIPRIFLRAQKSWFGLRIGRENSALDFEFHFGLSSSTEPQFLARTLRDIDDNPSTRMR